MTDTPASETQPARRARTPGVRYPGASLQRVHQALAVLDAAGGTATIGTLAARIRMSETNADFVRLVASCRSYGLADWANSARTALELTPDGEALFGQDEQVAQEARQKAALRPDVFQRVARRFEGRALPSPEDLNEAFVVAGVAGSAATLASRNFVESLAFAGLVDEEGGRQLLRTDLPYPEPESAGDAPRATAAGPARPATAARTSAAQPSGRAASHGRDTRRAQPAGRAAVAGDSGAQGAEAPAQQSVPPTRRPQPSVHIDIQVHIDPAATAEQIDQIFASMARHLYDRE